jgi:hypothetical protein
MLRPGKSCQQNKKARDINEGKREEFKSDFFFASSFAFSRLRGRISF